jgi:hypothetical protein
VPSSYTNVYLSTQLYPNADSNHPDKLFKVCCKPKKKTTQNKDNEDEGYNPDSVVLLNNPDEILNKGN